MYIATYVFENCSKSLIVKQIQILRNSNETFFGVIFKHYEKKIDRKNLLVYPDISNTADDDWKLIDRDAK